MKTLKMLLACLNTAVHLPAWLILIMSADLLYHGLGGLEWGWRIVGLLGGGALAYYVIHYWQPAKETT